MIRINREIDGYRFYDALYRGRRRDISVLRLHLTFSFILKRPPNAASR